MTGFSIEVVHHGSQFVMVVSGAVDIAHADHLTAIGLLVVNSLDGDAGDVIVDLARVPSVDRAGVSALIEIRDAAIGTGRDLVLREPQPSVSRLLAIAGLDQVFMIEMTEQSAVTLG
jgi:anti-sigma B factor antagonist